MAQQWFKHDYNSRSDDKILDLRAEYGWKGYGLFFAFIEKMCENETGAIDRDRIGGLSIGFGLPKDELLTFIDYCIKIGLFFEDEDGMIRNERATQHVEKLNSFREAGKKGAKKRWSNDSDRGANKGANGKPNTTPNADKIREDKIKQDNIKSVSTNGTDFPDSCEFLDEAKEIANYLLDAIILYDPTHKYANNKPAIDNWVLDIERAMRLDGRTKEQLKFIIDYVYKENKKHSAFWAGNVESGKKLRKHFDKIKNQIRQEANNGTIGKQETIEKEIQKFN
jgi:hypothetical protein